MKKIYFLLAGLVIMATILSACVPYNAEPEDQPQVPQSSSESTDQSSPEPIEQSTPEQTDLTTTESIEEKLTASEAQALLYERFGENVIILYAPEMDIQEDGVQLFCFSVDYSDMHEVIISNAIIKVWVKAVYYALCQSLDICKLIVNC